MTSPEPHAVRWFHLTPDRLILGLLPAEGLLFLSERLHWFPKGYAVLTAIAAVAVVMTLMFLWFTVALIFRWRFQYSIRSLLVLTVVVAVPCSWMTVEMKAAKRQREAAEAIRNLGGVVGYDYEWDASGQRISLASPPGPVWLRDLLGDDYFANAAIALIMSDAELQHVAALPELQELGIGFTSTGTFPVHPPRPHISDVGIENIRGLTRLKKLMLPETQVTDDALENLKGLNRLEELDLSDTQITDMGIENIKGLVRLEKLALDKTQVTDSGLTNLTELRQLQELILDGPRITDRGLESIQGLRQLRALDLGHSPVSKEGVNRLQQALPNWDGKRTRLELSPLPPSGFLSRPLPPVPQVLW